MMVSQLCQIDPLPSAEFVLNQSLRWWPLTPNLVGPIFKALLESNVHIHNR